jgi:hypothetical protein
VKYQVIDFNEKKGKKNRFFNDGIKIIFSASKGAGIEFHKKFKPLILIKNISLKS